MKHNKITRLGMLVAEFGFIELLLLANPKVQSVLQFHISLEG